MSGFALLLATLSVLATTTVADAQPRTRGRVIIETHHTDLAGNIRLSTNEAGDVTQRLDYAPFSEVDGRSCTGDGDPTRSPQFQGKLRDPKTCLDDFGARDYYMVTGRFQSVDPVLPIETALRDPQQWNRYAYGRNNPLIYTEPDGRAIDTIYDVISLGLSLRGVWRDPSSKANWVSLAVDAASVAIPGMPATGTLIRVADTADNVVDAGRVVENGASATTGGFNSFSSLKRALGPAGEGKQWHHIVEQSQVGKFGSQAIHNVDNVLAISTDIHQKISGVYSSKQPFTGAQMVRDWLAGQSFEQQRAFGQRCLRMFGVEQ